MIGRMEGVPSGTVGLRARGKLTKSDYVDVLGPAMKEAVETGDARVIFVLEGFDGLELAAFPEDFKTGFAVEFRHRSDWKKLAFVSDSEWVGKALHAFAWLTAGEVHIYPMDKLEEAKSWAAA